MPCRNVEAEHVGLFKPVKSSRGVRSRFPVVVHARSRTRTGTALRPADFKSAASTYSATRAEYAAWAAYPALILMASRM